MKVESILLTKGSEVGSRGVEAVVGATQEEEDGDVDQGDDERGDEGRDHARDGGVLDVGGRRVIPPVDGEAVHDGRSGGSSSPVQEGVKERKAQLVADGQLAPLLVLFTVRPWSRRKAMVL